MQKVVFLNGPSSSVKTSIANILQETTPDNFMQIGIDKVISMMPDHLNDWTGKQSTIGFWWEVTKDLNGKIYSNIKLGDFAEKVSMSFFSLTKALLNDGHNVIIDDVCLDPNKAQNWKQLLSNFNTFYIGITANLEDLEKREMSRKNRIIGSARAQAAIVHHTGFDYDLMINTSIKSSYQSTQDILDLL